MREVIALAGLSRADWLEARRQGIGSSDVGALMGLDRFRGPLDVYASKVAGEEQTSNLMMRLGNHMEDGIARAYADETGSEVTVPTHMYAHDNHPWMLANIDRFTDNEGLGVLEVKMSSRYEDWEDGAPEQYQLQCLHQLAVTGLPYADLAALIGGRELRMYRIERDELTISSLIQIERAFWDQVQRRDPPPPDHRSADALKRLYKGGADGVELDPSMGATIAELRLAQADEKTVTARVDLLKNELRAALGDHETGLIDGIPVATWGRSIRTSLDTARLEEDHAALIASYRKATPIRTLRLKKERR